MEPLLDEHVSVVQTEGSELATTSHEFPPAMAELAQPRDTAERYGKEFIIGPI